MSAPLGGASFELKAGRDSFRQDLLAALNDARQISEQIRQVLSGGAASPPIAAVAQGQSDTLKQLASGAEASNRQMTLLGKATQENIQPTQQLERAYKAAADQARQLAAAQDSVAISATRARAQAIATSRQTGNAGTIPPARALAPPQTSGGTQTIPPFDNDSSTLAGQQAKAWNDLVDAQLRSSAAMAGAVAVTDQNSAAIKRNVDEVKALIASQQALNSLVSAFARTDRIATGSEEIANAVGKAQAALASVQSGNYAEAFKALGDASQEARAALDLVNDEIAKLTGEAGPAVQGLAQMMDELDRLNNAPSSANEARRLELSNKVTQAAFGGEGSDDEEAGQIQRLIALNAQAKNLTQSFSQLSAAQNRLTEDTGKSEAAQRKLGQELIKQAQAEQARIAANDRARATVAQVTTDPRLQARQDTIAVLSQSGLKAAEAEKAVGKLQTAILGIDKARVGTSVVEGLASIDQAANLSQRAMDAFASGDRAAGIEYQRKAIEALRAAMLELDTAAEQARKGIVGAFTPEKNEQFGQIVAQAGKVQTAINQSRAGLVASSAPEIAAAKKAADDQKKDLDKAANLADNNSRQSRQLRSQLFSSAQDLGYALNLGQGGQLFAGIGRLGEVVKAAGLAEGTAAALGLSAGIVAVGAAFVGTVAVGLSFNAFLETSRVQMQATEGSAEAAKKAIDELLQQATSRKFGAFDFKDLEQGEALLKRMGQGSVEQETRIANVAAATGQTFSQTAQQVGHFYDVIQSGQPLGDMIRSLERAGIITSDFGDRLAAARASGASEAEILEILNQAFDKYSGTAERAGATTTASLTRIKLGLEAAAGTATERGFDTLGVRLATLADILTSQEFRDAIGNLAALYAKLAEFALYAAAPITIPIVYQVKRVFDNQPVGSVLHDVGLEQQANSAPLGEARYTITRQAIESGRQTVDAYVQGFDERSRTAFDDLTQTFERGLTAAMGGTLTAEQQARIAGTINPLLAQVTDEIQKQGSVSEETAGKVRDALGDQAKSVLQLADNYAHLRTAVDAAVAAQTRVDTAQRNLSITQDTRQGILDIDQTAIDNANTVAETHRKEASDQIEQLRHQIAATQHLADFVDKPLAAISEALQQTIKDLERANRDAAQAAQQVIEGKQRDLSDYQRSISDRRAAVQVEFDAMQKGIDTLQQRVQAQRDAQTQHQDAFNAAINGTIDLFNEVNDQQDEITKKIIAKWDAEISGARRARLESQQKVDETELQSLELQLEYNKRIQAARQNGREDEARALERERDRVLAARQKAGQVDRDEAELARRREQQAINEAKAAQAQQQADDQRGINQTTGQLTAAQQELQDAKDVEAQRQKNEDREVQRRQDEIQHLQDVEKARADAAAAEIQRDQDALDANEAERTANKKKFDEEIAGYNLSIEKIQDQQYEQAKLDQIAIDGAKATYDADKIFWDARVKADQKALDDAKGVLAAALYTQDYYQKQITSLDDINKRLDDRIAKENEILRLLREQNGLPVQQPNSGAQGGGRDTHATPADASGAPDPNASGNEGGGGKPPLLPGNSYTDPPPRYHLEYDIGANPWFVPNGYTLRDYGKEPLPGGPIGGNNNPIAGQTSGRSDRQSPTYAYARGGPIYEPVRGIGQTSGARYLFGDAGTEYVVPAASLPPASHSSNVTGPLVSIGTVNASDPLDVDRLMARLQRTMAQAGLSATEQMRSRGVYDGRGRR